MNAWTIAAYILFTWAFMISYRARKTDMPQGFRSWITFLLITPILLPIALPFMIAAWIRRRSDQHRYRKYRARDSDEPYEGRGPEGTTGSSGGE